MSGSSGSSTQVAFMCRGCDKDWWIARKALQDDDIDGCPAQYLEIRHGRPTRCPICGIMKGVDEALGNLLSHFPFLETEGMAATENMEEWEVGGLIKPYKSEEERGNGGESDGMTVEEREAMTDKTIKSFVKTAGQGITEEEAFAEEEPSEESDESAVDGTIEEAMRVFGMDWETQTLGEDPEVDSYQKEA